MPRLKRGMTTERQCVPHGSVANLKRPVSFSVRASKVRISRPAGVSTVTTTRSAETVVEVMPAPSAACSLQRLNRRSNFGD